MKVFISVDIEGVTGVVSWGQCGRPSSECFDYDFARRMMTHDANAAIRGARAGGATEIFLKDSHGNSKNLLIDQLEPDVQLLSGNTPHDNGMMTGIDSSFDCAMLVGYHAMAGTKAGVMEHTITGGVHRFWINDIESGEIAMSAYTAGQFDVPVVMVSSDDKGCYEANQLVKGVEVVETKVGMGRYLAKLKHPNVTGASIEGAAKRAVESLPFVDPVKITGAARVKIEFNTSEQADISGMLPGWNRLDGYTIEFQGSSWQEAHQVARRAMAQTYRD